MTNEQFMTCDYCKRILYYIPPSPKPEEAKAAKADALPVDASPGEDSTSGETASQ
jgi:hypothetical protein